jgi:hypothetical protein
MFPLIIFPLPFTPFAFIKELEFSRFGRFIGLLLFVGSSQTARPSTVAKVMLNKKILNIIPPSAIDFPTSASLG